MAEPVETLAALIVQLADADPRRREKAAGELFRRGCAAAEPALRNWFADAEFRALVRTGNKLLTVGIAVTPARFAEIHQRFAGTLLSEVPPEADVREFTLEFAHGVRLDILTPRDPAEAGAIARFLERFGECIQQVECEVRDVTRATQILRARFALEPVYPEAHAGAGGTRVNFFLVPTTEGRKVLMELVEIPARQDTRERKGKPSG
jgi:hypothetical protein